MSPAARRALALAAGAALCLAGFAAVRAAPDARTRLEALNLRETTLSAQQGRNANQLARLLSVLQRFSRSPPPALLVDPEDAKDAVRAAILVKAMTPALQARAQAYAGEATEIARQRRLAAVASATLFSRESEQAEHPAEPPEPADAPLLRGYSESALGPETPPAALLAPVAGPRIQAFGAGLPGGGRTNGATFSGSPGAQVVSPGDGEVRYVGPVRGWGVVLILRLTGGYHLVLAGLDRTSVDVGQSVAAGAPVGWLPDERHSKSELYLEVRERGVPVDPGRWMRTGGG